MNEFVWNTRLDDEDSGSAKSEALGCWDFAKETAITKLTDSIRQWKDKDIGGAPKDPLTYHGECWFPKKLNKDKNAVATYEIKLKIGVVNIVLGENKNGKPLKSKQVYPDELLDSLEMMLNTVSKFQSKNDGVIAQRMYEASYNTKKPKGKGDNGKTLDIGSVKTNPTTKVSRTLAFENDMWVWH